MKDLLLKHITTYVPLDLYDQNVLLPFLHVKRYGDEEILLEPGLVCTELCFVISGGLRMYRIAEDKTGRVIQMAIKGHWISDLYSFQSNEPSAYFIRAMDKTEVISISNVNYTDLFSQVPLFEIYFRIMMQQGYQESLKKIELLLNHGGDKPFIRFNELYPDMIRRVSIPVLASLLRAAYEFACFLETRNQLAAEGL